MYMKNIIDYLNEFGHNSFSDSPFNEVDALILSQLSYFQWERVESYVNEKMVPFQSVPFSIEMVEHTFSCKDSHKLYDAVIKSNRFEHMKFGFFQSILNKERDEQFSAITFECEEGIYDIVYRGTDSTLIGWKEDFNLSFSIHTSAQKSALKYLEKMQMHQKKYRLMGHSKGGNLATYCGCIIQDPTNIIHIYNFDGPGFLPGTIDINRIYLIYSKYIPRESIIGLIMQEDENYTIVNAKNRHIYQHDPFNWSVNQTSYETVNSLDALAIFVQRSANQWLLHANIEKRQFFFDTIFQLLDEQGKSSFDDFTFQDVWNVLKEYKNVDNEAKEIVDELIKLLLNSNLQQTKEMIGDFIDSKIKKE